MNTLHRAVGLLVVVAVLVLLTVAVALAQPSRPIARPSAPAPAPEPVPAPPTAPAPAARPTPARPTARPTASRPATPADMRLTPSRPAAARPTASRPTASRPTASRPTAARPTPSRPTPTTRPRTATPRPRVAEEYEESDTAAVDEAPIPDVLLPRTPPPSSGGVVEYNIPICPEGRAFTDPMNVWSHWFQVLPGVTLVNKCYLLLHYTTSGTLLPREGGLNVYLNGQPVGTMPLDPNVVGAEWRVPLPVSFMREGFNELRITARQRSTEGLCRDVDNTSNWVRFSRSSLLHLERKALLQYPLYAYPFPYMDPLAPSPVRSVWYLPPTPTEAEVHDALRMASDWGERELGRPLPISVRTTDPAGDPNNAILLGVRSRWPNLIAGDTVPDRSGLLWSLPVGPPTQGASRSGARLVVSGADQTAMDNVQYVLSMPDMVRQLDAVQERIAPRPLGTINGQPFGRQITFNQLGYAQVQLVGAFHQKSTIVIMRPIGMEIGKETSITLRFRHSASLIQRSLMSVYINSIAVGSAALDPSNSNGGVIAVRVPTSELGKNRWVLELACYHELGAVDCAKLFGDVAWTVIDGDSTISFGPGRMPAWPTVAGFPYLVPAGEGRIGVTMWLPREPTDQQLTAAAMVAARAAQVNPLPIDWTVVMGDTLDDAARKQSIIIIGSGHDTARFADMKRLPVYPGSAGGYEIRTTLNLLPSAMRDAAILEAGVSPWRKDRVVYAVLADTDEALGRLCATLAMPTIGSKLDGDVCLVTAEGKAIMLDSVTKEERERSVTAEANRYTWPMILVMAVLALGVISLLGWGARQFRKRPAPARPSPPPAMGGDSGGDHHIIN